MPTGLVPVAGLASSCGGAWQQAAPFAQQSPVRAEEPLGQTADVSTRGGRAAAVNRRYQRRFTPCDLVAKPRVASTAGVALEDWVETPQRPTWIHPRRNDRSLIIVAVERAKPNLEQLKRLLRKPVRFSLYDHPSLCGARTFDPVSPAIGTPRIDNHGACIVAKRPAVAAVAALDG